MKRSYSSILINLLAILFLLATFYLQYDFLFVTRLILVVFAIAYLVIEIKIEYFSSQKTIVLIFSAMSIVALIVSVVFENSPLNGLTNERVFFIPLYVFMLIVMMYRNLYEENDKKNKTNKY